MSPIAIRIYQKIINRINANVLNDTDRSYMAAYFEGNDATELARLMIQERERDSAHAAYLASDEITIPAIEALKFHRQLQEDIAALWNPSWDDIYACASGYDALSDEAKRYLTPLRARDDSFANLPRYVDPHVVHKLPLDAERRAYLKLFQIKLNALSVSP